MQFEEALSELIASVWGTYRPLVPIFDPAVAYDPDVIVRVSRMERLTASPRDAARLRSELDDFDIRPLLPSVSCPVLVTGLSGSVTPLAAVRFLADQLADAQFVELPGSFVPTVADATVVGKAVASFLGP